MNEKIERYDSAKDTIDHIKNVGKLISQIITRLEFRSILHDESKLKSPEKEYFDKFTPKLSSVTYGSDEYRNMLKEMKPAIEHHHKNNRHHPEHFKNGIDGMDLIDLIELFCDWKAATLRHSDGDLMKSIDINSKRHNINPQLVKILINTKKNIGW